MACQLSLTKVSRSFRSAGEGYGTSWSDSHLSSSVSCHLLYAIDSQYLEQQVFSQILYSPALLPGNQLLAIATSVVASATKSVFAQENLMLIESGLAELEVVQSDGERGGKELQRIIEYKRVWNVDIHRHRQFDRHDQGSR